MRLATYNVNSIRARLPRVLEWLEEAQPDVVAMQETKVEDDKFPRAEIEAAGYHVHFHGQKTYNGVALLSKEPASDVVFGFSPGWPEDCRVVRGVFDGVLVINTYVPNGTVVGSDKWDYKMRWLEQFKAFCSEVAAPTDNVVWLGDINIAPTPADVYDSARMLGGVGHHPDEFSRLAQIKEWGWTDVFRLQGDDPGYYTFWDFRIPMSFERNLGWRIDHVYVTEPLLASAGGCWVDKDTRAREKPSDHAPVVFNLKV